MYIIFIFCCIFQETNVKLFHNAHNSLLTLSHTCHVYVRHSAPGWHKCFKCYCFYLMIGCHLPLLSRCLMSQWVTWCHARATYQLLLQCLAESQWALIDMLILLQPSRWVKVIPRTNTVCHQDAVIIRMTSLKTWCLWHENIANGWQNTHTHIPYMSIILLNTPVKMV